jgi:hypothetical protein
VRPALRLPAAALRRLTVQQYANTVTDLLGARVVVPAVEADAVSDDEFTLTSVAAAPVRAWPPSPSASCWCDPEG